MKHLAPLVLPLALLCLVGCAGPSVSPDEVLAWRGEGLLARPAEQRGMRADDRAEVERLRNADELDAARQLALALVAEDPNVPELQYLASRAESDGLFLMDSSDKRSRNLAAESARQYALRAWQLGARDAAAEAQLAWTYGTTTHLQPMFERSRHARLTIDIAERALGIDPEEPTALATLAVVNLRLQTLPWIANVMASDVPDSSLEAAEDYARRAVAALPSRENRLILAKVLVAADRKEEARRELESALAEPARFPRDGALTPELRTLLATLG
ncbi:MAG: hypothetical protein GC161_12485 [Planctomycetaceae bacterium]|nr:hypothetical protein [Planctomycetaceae bacterium]